MTMLNVFLAVVVLLTLTSCGDDFDAEAEEKAVMAAFNEITDALAETDYEVILSHTHKDWTSFETWPDPGDQYVLSYEDIGPDWPVIKYHLNDYELIMSPDLAVIKGYVTIQTPPDPESDVYHTVVFKKEEGQWYMIHGHVSFMP